MKYFGGGDLSLSGTGIVIMDEDGEVVFTKTLFNDLRGMERLAFIREEIRAAFTLFKPTLCCVEDYAMGIRDGRSFSIGENGGVVKLLLHDMGIETVLVSPTALKKFITCGGKADKDMMMMMVLKNFGYESSNNNEADAFGLSELARILYTENYSELQPAQVEAVQDILDPGTKVAKKKAEKKAKAERKAKKAAPKRRLLNVGKTGN